MASYSVRALVLRKTKLGEADTIVTLLAADGRQIRAVAKGMRKPGSRFGGRLEPYSVVDLLVHEGRSLDIVTEVESVTTHASLREDFDRSAAAAVLCDVLEKISLAGQVEVRLFGLAEATLRALGAAEPERLPLLVVAFLVKAMAMHGYRPELESCASCAESAVGGRLFSLGAGGVLCPQCGERESGAIVLSDEARQLLDLLLRSTMTEISALSAPDRTVKECFDLMRGFVAFHVPARLKALDFYGSVFR